MLKVIIKGELPDLNTEINEAKKHWSYYAKHKQYWTNYIALTVQSQKLPKIISPIKPKFIWYTKNERKDCDNISFAKKYILDGFVKAGLIENDNRKCIKGFNGDDFKVDKENPRVEVELN